MCFFYGRVVVVQVLFNAIMYKSRCASDVKFVASLAGDLEHVQVLRRHRLVFAIGQFVLVHVFWVW